MAMPTKSKGPASDSIMTPDKMKPLLALSKKEPVQAAIGLTADGEGLLLLDKRAKPKKVMSMLRADAGKAHLQLNAASLRFGRAEVDPDYDPAMVRLFVNKETPGVMRVKLVEIVKRVPYQKVEINVDPSLEEEPEDEDHIQDTAPESVAPVPPPLPPTGHGPESGGLAHVLAELAHHIAGVADTGLKARLAQLAGGANTAIKTNNLHAAAQVIKEIRALLGHAGITQPPPPDPTSLVHGLQALVHRIAEVAGDDESLRTSLSGLASMAGSAIKGHELDSAAELITRLRKALDESTPSGTRPLVDIGAIWRDAKESVDEGLNKLATELRSYEDPDLERIADYGLFGIGTGENVALNKAMIEYSRARPDQRRDLAAKVLNAVNDYRALLQKEPMVDLIDQNPVVPMSMRATIDGALEQIAHAVA
jgi:hypothetical protein